MHPTPNFSILLYQDTIHITSIYHFKVDVSSMSTEPSPLSDSRRTHPGKQVLSVSVVSPVSLPVLPPFCARVLAQWIFQVAEIIQFMILRAWFLSHSAFPMLHTVHVSCSIFLASCSPLAGTQGTQVIVLR